MKRFVSLHLVVALCALALSPSLACATHPVTDISVDHYRIFPRFSRLNVFHRSPDFPIDPFPGEHTLSGVYDLQRVDFDHPYEGRASFENAEMWAAPNCQTPCIAVAIVFDADEILNLEELKGVQLPVLAPFDVYQFSGTVQSGLPINLYAAVLGPWMYVRGHTEPAPDSNGAPGLSVHWLARTRPFADLNDDGVVDTADYVVLRNAEASGGTSIGSFQDATARITYEDWRQQFGETIPDLAAMDAALSTAAGAGTLAAAAVPEPTTALIALGACAMLVRSRRRTNSSGSFEVALF